MKKTMKVMALLLCAIMMATVLSSCSKEANYQSRIIGKWQMTRHYGHTMFESFDHTYENDGNIWIFNSDGIFQRQTQYGIEVSGNYTIRENSVIIPLQELQILELTNATMILYEEYGSYEDTYEFKKL